MIQKYWLLMKLEFTRKSIDIRKGTTKKIKKTEVVRTRRRLIQKNRDNNYEEIVLL